MRMRLVLAVIVLVVGVAGYLVWQRSATPEVRTARMLGTEGGPVAGEGALPAQGPGVSWKTPKRWTEEPAGGMRLATYVVPPSVAGGEAARCPVYYFGPGQGGGAEANIERWIAEFESPGKPQRRDFEVKGIKVTQVEVSGTYLAHAGMEEGAPGGSSGWTLLGAIVEGPGGAVFFKLAGPTATVAPAKKEFEGMLASLK